MADIFLSYSRADRPIAQVVAEALEAEGFSVWWDKVLSAGQTYDEVTENMLRDSSIVVVLWSLTSVKSKWVRAEATLGERSSTVIPAMIEDAERPIMFELTQTADLIGWSGDRSGQRWQDFVSDIRGALSRAEGSPVAAPAQSVQTAALAEDDDATIETVFWTSIKDGSDPADFEAYLNRYPSGHYSDLARNRLAAFSAAQSRPPPQPAEAHSAPARTAPSAPAMSSSSPSKSIFAVLGVAVLAALIGGGFYLFSGSTDGEQDTSEPKTLAETCSHCPEMVAVPSGTFLMGSPRSEANRTGNEGPQREVTVPGFAISKFEVTVSEWMACVEDGACREPIAGSEAQMPVSMVNWNDAHTYAQWLSSTSGEVYRLPTEAEWEYAARGGTQTAYWWGNNFQSSPARLNALQDSTALPENPFGLVGMHGNLREWVEDCYVNNYTSAPTNGAAVLEGDCSNRIVRGGSFSTGPAEHRAANRARFSVSVRDKSLGFRVVRSDGN